MIDGLGRGRRWARTLSFLAVCVAAASCADSSSINGIAPGQARLSLGPRFATTPAGGPVVTLSRIDAYLIPPSGDSTFSTAPFVEGSANLSFEIRLPGGETDVTLDLTGFDANGVEAYHARQTYRLKPGNNNLVQPELVYSAPDSRVTDLRVSPSSMSVDVGGTGTLSVTGFGANETTISPVLVGWTSRNTAVLTVSDDGTVTGIAKGQAYVVARTATGVADSALVTVQAMTVLPEKAEKLPNGTQQFSVVGGGQGPFTWTVNGVAGGNATFGTITAAGFYTAPGKVPTPSTFDVCAVRTSPSATACASVTINPVPTSGADVIVFNDINTFDDPGASDLNNQSMFVNLVNFTGEGARTSQKGVLFYSGHQSQNDFALVGLRSTITGAGYVISDTSSDFTEPVPSNIKTLFLFLPTVQFSPAEINILKLFAGEGGRIVFVGEHSGFYGGIEAENAFFASMGAQMTNVGGMVDCSTNVEPFESLRPHQVTTGLKQLTIACASEVIPGPNDYVFLYDKSNTKALAAVAKIDLTPVPETVVNNSRVRTTAPALRADRRTGPSVGKIDPRDPAGRPVRRTTP